MIRPNIILIVILFLLVSCKKDKADKDLVNSTNSGRSYFIDTLNTTAESDQSLYVAISGTLRRESVYILQENKQASFDLYKTDLEANLLFTTKINLGKGLLVDLCGSKVSEDFYTLSATNNFYPAPPMYMNAFVDYGGIKDSAACRLNERLSDFQFEISFNPEGEIKGANFSELKMFNKSGKEKWTKILDGNFFSGNALETDAQGNVYVLTASFNPKKLKPDPKLSGLTPYYNCKQDSNSFTLYKFTKDGLEVFKKTIQHVSDNIRFNPSMQVSANAIFVKSPYDFFTFHIDGALLSSSKPYKNVCYNAIDEFRANPITHQTLLSGQLRFTIPNTEFYFLSENNAAFKQLSKWPGQLLAIDSRNNFYTTGNTLTKISGQGTTIYSQQLQINFDIFSIDEFNHVIDAYDNFYCFTVKNGAIMCWKLNENGRYR